MSYENHGWRHRPKSEGGTDPIPTTTGFMPSWCTAQRGSNTVSATSAGALGVYYRPRLRYLTTNDTDCFELAGNSSGFSDYIQINKDGYYHCFFNIQRAGGGSDGWDGIYTAIQGIMNVSAADVDIETQVGLADWHPSPLNPFSEALEEEVYGPPTHASLSLIVGLDYRSGETLDSPLQVACRLLADSGSSLSLITQIHVVRLADGTGVSQTDSDDLS